MKKLLGIVVLGLLWCTVSFSESVYLRCEGDYVEKKRNNEIVREAIPYFSLLKIDFKNRYFFRDEDADTKEYFILDGDFLKYYEIGPSFGGGFSGSHSVISRVTGKWDFKLVNFEENIYKRVVKEFYELDKTTSLNDNEYHSIKKSFDRSIELKKFKIMEQVYNDKNLYNFEFSNAIWNCKKKAKAF